MIGDMPSETISKIHLVDLAGRLVYYTAFKPVACRICRGIVGPVSKIILFSFYAVNSRGRWIGVSESQW